MVQQRADIWGAFEHAAAGIEVIVQARGIERDVGEVDHVVPLAQDGLYSSASSRCIHASRSISRVVHSCTSGSPNSWAFGTVPVCR
jgi:hypothetical protein